MKNFFILVVLVGIITTSIIPSIYAPPEPMPEDSFRFSDHVLTGKVVSSKVIPNPNEDTAQKKYHDTVVYEIQVLEWHKNPLNNNTITVYGDHYPNDVEPEPMWGVVEFEIGSIVYLYLDTTEDGLEFREYDSTLIAESLPSSQDYEFEKLSGANCRDKNSQCYGTFSNGTTIPIQCDYRHSCGVVSFDSYKVSHNNPPLTQIQAGIHYNDVHCRDDRVLVLKQSEEFASCVYKETVMKLFQRGWALPEAPIVDTNTIQQESKLIKITGIINRFDTIEGFEYQLIPLEEELPRIAYTGYDTINLLSTKDTVHQFIRDIDGDLVKVHGRFILNDQGEYKRHFSGFPIIPAEKVEKISENLDLEYTINGAEVVSITKLHDMNTVNIVLEESYGGSLTITLPRELIDAKISEDVDDLFFVLIDGEEVPYEENTNDTTRTPTIDFEKGARIIEIIATIPI